MLKALKEPGAWILLFLPLVFLWRFAFLGESFVPGDILLTSYPWKGMQPDPAVPNNSLISDQVYLFYPWADFARKAFEAGCYPAWNPHAGAGVPFAANYQNAIHAPLQWLAILAGPALGTGIAAFCKLAISGVGMYVLLRLWRLNSLACVLGAVLATYHFFNVAWLGYPMTQVNVFLPWLLITVQRLAENPNRRNAALLALVVGLVMSGGHPQSSLFLLTASLLFFLLLCFRTFRQNPSGCRNSGLFKQCTMALVAVTLGIGLLAPQILPFSEYASRSSTMEVRQHILAATFQTGGSVGDVLGRIFSWSLTAGLPPQSAFGFLMPFFLGSPNLPASDWGVWNFNERSLYPGVAALFLAGLALMLRPASHRFLLGYFFLVLVCALGLVFGFPGFRGLMLLPPARLAVHTRFAFEICWCLALLAALGLHAIMEGASLGKGRLALRITLMGCILLAIAGWIWELIPSMVDNPFAQRSSLEIFEKYVSSQVTLFAALAAVLLALLLWLVAASRKNLPAIMVVLVGASDLVLLGMPVNTYFKGAVAPSTPLIRFLRDNLQEARFLSLGDCLPPNTGMLFELNDIRGEDAMENALMGRFVRPPGVDVDIDAFFLSRKGSIQRDWILNLLNVRYIVTPPDIDLASKPSEWMPRGITVRQRYQGPDGRVYENLQVQPKAFLVGRCRAFPEEDAVRNAMWERDWDPRQEVLLTSRISPELSVDCRSTSRATGSVKVLEYKPESIKLAVTAEEDAWLVLGEAYYPGWHAVVDDVRTEVLQADYALRAIRIPAGSHVACFSYRSRWLIPGVAIGACCLIMVTVFLCVPKRERGGEHRW